MGKQTGSVLMSDVNKAHIVMERGKGVYLYDDRGKKYLDAAAGVGVVSLGYGVQEIADVLQEQAMRLPYVHSLRFANEPMIDLASKIARLAPGSLNKAFFVSGGSEAAESAIKLARQYHLERGRGTKYRVIGRWQSFHGNTLAALSAGGHPGRRARHVPLLLDFPHVPEANCYRCPFEKSYPECQVACARALEDAIVRNGADSIAAFFAEPIVGAAAGATVPVPEYFRIIRDICDRYDVLFIADEVITGFGRTGTVFGIEHWGVEPDIMIVAKGISSGYAPLGGVILKDSIAQAFAEGSGWFEHNFTYAGNPLSCAVGARVIDIMERDHVMETVPAKGEYLFSRMASLADNPFIGEIRGRGLLMGIELVKDKRTKTPFPVERNAHAVFNKHALAHGLVVYPCSGTADGVRGNHLLIMPPLVISYEEIDELVSLFSAALEDFTAEASNW